MLHESEEPELLVFGGFEETSHRACLGLSADCVADDTFVGEDALLGCEPAGVEWVVGKGEDTEDGHNEGNGTLNDEHLWKELAM